MIDDVEVSEVVFEDAGAEEAEHAQEDQPQGPFPTDLDKAAKYLTKRGFALFPVKLMTRVEGGKEKLDKTPLCLWANASTLDSQIITSMLDNRRKQGITEGLALGLDCGKSGLFAFDVDVRNGAQGMASLAALEATYGSLPRTWVSRTPSGGLHYWFRGQGRNS